ncbi:MAG: hypothetical protein AAFQ94_14245 [Bacteroidota bacterium]
MIYKKQNTHPLIKYIDHWEAFNIKIRKSDRYYVVSAFLATLCFTALICVILN